MIKSAFAVACASIMASIAFPQPVFAQDESDQRLGTVHCDCPYAETSQPEPAALLNTVPPDSNRLW